VLLPEEEKNPEQNALHISLVSDSDDPREMVFNRPSSSNVIIEEEGEEELIVEPRRSDYNMFPNMHRIQTRSRGEVEIAEVVGSYQAANPISGSQDSMIVNTSEVIEVYESQRQDPNYYLQIMADSWGERTLEYERRVREAQETEASRNEGNRRITRSMSRSGQSSNNSRSSHRSHTSNNRSGGTRGRRAQRQQ
jgi:hypothetical protein